MENVDVLVVKVKKTVEKIKKLTYENRKLKIEMEYLRKEKEHNDNQAGECVVLRKNAEEAAVKIERIIKKIDTMKVL